MKSGLIKLGGTPLQLYISINPSLITAIKITTQSLQFEWLYFIPHLKANNRLEGSPLGEVERRRSILQQANLWIIKATGYTANVRANDPDQGERKFSIP